MATIAWIGLGNMGGPMTANLVAAGHTVRGYDLSEEALQAATAGGVTPVGSAVEALQGADVAFTMVPRGEHARAAYDGDEGLFAHAPEGLLLIDSSTIDVETAQHLHDEAAERGLRFVDAPVSGGTAGAVKGTLTFMIGGSAEHVAAAKEYIEPMAGNMIETGGPTSGQAAKICNNLMLGINLIATSEGATLAERLGLDQKVFQSIAAVSSGDSWALRTWYPKPGVVDTSPANNDFAATFANDLALKDLSLAVAAADLTGTALEFGRLATSYYQQVHDAGLGGLDCSAVVKVVDGTLPTSSHTDGDES